MSLDPETNNRAGGLTPLLETALSRLLRAAPATGRYQEVVEIESLSVTISGPSTQDNIAAAAAGAIASVLRGGK